MNIVELIAYDEGKFNQKCKFGNLIGDHAVYCHSDDPNAPRKCSRTWYSGGLIKDEDCKYYQSNTI